MIIFKVCCSHHYLILQLAFSAIELDYASSSKATLMCQGAEARLYECTYLGRDAVMKERFSKSYRHPDLDARLTKERIRNEFRAITKCQLVC